MMKDLRSTLSMPRLRPSGRRLGATPEMIWGEKERERGIERERDREGEGESISAPWSPPKSQNPCKFAEKRPEGLKDMKKTSWRDP